ncbi:MAG: PEP/pyruvate-binding domain-containing protein [Pseudomonadota bacterium]|nr:PEP/pyruvate-binding domain-containing protein [Pseudomonadota bacterium]
MALALVLLLAGCEAPPPPEELDETACAEASERVGGTVCLHRIEDRAQWESVAVVADVVDQDRTTKYLVPVSSGEVLPTVFVNANRYYLHYDFLREAFPDAFAALTWGQYVAMIIDPSVRRYFGGDVTEYIEADGSRRFGFIVWDDPADASTTITYDEVLTVWTELQGRFRLGALMFAPNSSNQRAAAATWVDAPFAIRGEDNLAYEAYTEGVGFGTVRRVPLAELAAATAAASFGYQDILVLDEAPFDVERIVSGIVTGSRQGTLSHLNVRSAARGTPNCYLEDPFAALAAWEGVLVRFECGVESWSIGAATPEEAEAFWEELRPEPVTIPAADLSVTEPLDLLDVPTDTVAERDLALVRYGAKGANLATLYQRIDPGYQIDGLVVPFAWYDSFVRTNTWDVDGETLTFQATLDRWLVDATFTSDAAFRAERLAELRAAMLEAPVDPAQLVTLAAVIQDTWGDDLTMVRLRSSSNAEDGLSFSGAGLYESVSACLADETDADTQGPSLCDADKDNERTVSDALRGVWASVWLSGAYEERDWYGIDHRLVSMAILVNTQSEDEQANIVGFTGHPTLEDPRWLVESQLGDLDVVSAEPGVWPEQVLLTLVGGAVTSIDRVTQSSEAAEVLSDSQLEALGVLLWDVAAVFPVDDEVPDGGTLLLDTECKVLDDGRLVIKQVRPYLRD